MVFKGYGSITGWYCTSVEIVQSGPIALSKNLTIAEVWSVEDEGDQVAVRSSTPTYFRAFGSDILREKSREESQS
jgi:hypothetical protein